MGTITVITGANKGLGYETARRLVERGHTVVAGARDPERGRAAAAALGARFVQIDVTDDASVAAAAQDVAAHEGRVDLLVNNAGIGGIESPTEELRGPEALRVLDTNVAGIVRVTGAFLELLRRAEHPAIVNVGSSMGSLARILDPDRPESHAIVPAYSASKAGVTLLTAQYAKALPDIRVNAVDPGYTATDFNGHGGHQTVEEGAEAIVAVVTEGPDAGTGRFVDRLGPVPTG